MRGLLNTILVVLVGILIVLVLAIALGGCGAPLTDNDRYEFRLITIDETLSCPMPERPH